MLNGAILAGMPRKDDASPIDENAASSDSSQFDGASSPGPEDAQPSAAYGAAPAGGDVSPASPAGDVSGELAIEPVPPTDEMAASVEGDDDRGTYAVPEWDPIGVVVPGQLGDLAFFVVRSLGRGDGGHYDEICADIVRDRQRQAGLAPSGIVSGDTWALLLPRVDETSRGEPVAFLKRLLGVTTPFRFPTEELKAFLVDITGEENPPLVVDTDTWVHLIADAVFFHEAELAAASES